MDLICSYEDHNNRIKNLDTNLRSNSHYFASQEIYEPCNFNTENVSLTL